MPGYAAVRPQDPWAGNATLALALTLVGACSTATAVRGENTALRSNQPLDVCPARMPPSRAPGGGDVVSLAIGVVNQCAVMGDQTVMCRGNNGMGELGVGVGGLQRSPVAVPGLSGVVDVQLSGNGAVCALTGSGEVWCWGSNRAGELGIGHERDEACGEHASRRDYCRRHPTRVQGIPRAVRLVVGGQLVCIVAVDRSVWCWGTSVEGGRRVEHATPFQVAPPSDLIDLANVYDHVVMTYAGGRVVGESENIPREIPPGARLVANFSGDICAILEDRSVRCRWQGVSCAPPGIEAPAECVTLRETGLRCVADLAIGFDHSCALHLDGRVSCWGSNDYGQTGQDVAASSTCHQSRCTPRPLPVSGIDRVVSVFTGGFQTCAIRDDRSVWCWGVVGGASTHVPVRVVW